MSRPRLSRAAAPLRHAPAEDRARLYEAVLRAQGYCVIPDLLPRAVIDRIDADLSPALADTLFSVGDFYGTHTKRAGRLLTRTRLGAMLVQQPLILALAHAILAPFCDMVQLNLTQAIEIHPGAPAQMPHRDQDMWAGRKGEMEYLVNIMWPLSPFRSDNGATLIWPHSHGPRALDPAPPETPVPLECDPGAAIVFLGSTLHGAGANISGHVRRGVIVSYALGWLKPYENPWLAYPPEIARHFSPDLARLVGYALHRPNLGNFEGMCPSILLGDTLPAQFGAVDALRPDQVDLLAAHARQQKAATPETDDRADMRTTVPQ